MSRRVGKSRYSPEEDQEVPSYPTDEVPAEQPRQDGLEDEAASYYRRQARRSSVASSGRADAEDVTRGMGSLSVDQAASRDSSEYTHRPGSETRASSSTARVRTGGRIWYAPKESITDTRLLEKGYGARARVIGSREKTEPLDKRYKRQSNPTAFFKVGRVIKVLWSEPIGFSGDNLTVVTMEQKFAGEKVAVKIRWFVVIMEGDKWCTCLPISTYGGYGLTRKDLHKWQHSVIYASRTQPSLLVGEEPQAGEHGFRLPIRVKARERQSAMEKTSRLHYAKMYTIEHNVKVFDFGMVVDEHIPVMVAQWRQVMGWTHPTADASQNSYGGAANLESVQEDVPDEQEDDEDEDEDEDEPPPAYIDFAVVQRTYRPTAKNMEVGHINITESDRLGIIEGYTSGWFRAWNASTRESGLVWKDYILLDSDVPGQ